MAIPSLTIIGETHQRFGPLDEEAVRRGRHRGPAGAGPLPGRARGGLHRRERRRPLAGVHGRHGPQDPGRDGQAAVDRHARPGDRPGRPGGLRPRPGRRAEADPQLDHAAAGRHVRPLHDSALPADPAGLRAGGRRRSRGPAARPRRPTPRPRYLVQIFQERCPGAANDDCIIDPGHRPDRQRLRGEPEAADRARWS